MVAAGATDYPARPITLIVPQSAGGTNDLVGRVVGERLGSALGGKVVVENRVGSGGNIGAAAVARAPKTGYTLLMTVSSALVINPAIYKSTGFDPVADFTPIAMIGTVPNVLVVSPNFPARSLDEFIKLVKARPGQYRYASAGSGSLNHLLGEMLNVSAGLQLRHVPYRGIVPALDDVMDGQVPMAFSALPPALRHVREGRLVAIGVSSQQRSPTLPNVPAIAEKVPGYAGTIWIGLFAPRGVPAEVESRLAAAMENVLSAPELQSLLRGYGIELARITRAEFAAQLRDDTVRWASIVKASRAKRD